MKVVYKIYKENYCEFEYFDGDEWRKTESDDLTLVCINSIINCKKYEYETEEEAMLALEEIMDNFDYTFTILKCYKK